ncbi:MAG: hypothetical protein FWE47_02830 [Oscillospiraceae bacterium]|nr:hypothetical protein [Oscillospiraceae bacterium]
MRNHERKAKNKSVRKELVRASDWQPPQAMQDTINNRKMTERSEALPPGNRYYIGATIEEMLK